MLHIYKYRKILSIYVNVVEFTDYWVCKMGVGYFGLGAAGTLPVSLYGLGWDLPLPER